MHSVYTQIRGICTTPSFQSADNMVIVPEIAYLK